MRAWRPVSSMCETSASGTDCSCIGLADLLGLCFLPRIHQVGSQSLIGVGHDLPLYLEDDEDTIRDMLPAVASHTWILVADFSEKIHRHFQGAICLLGSGSQLQMKSQDLCCDEPALCMQKK